MLQFKVDGSDPMESTLRSCFKTPNRIWTFHFNAENRILRRPRDELRTSKLSKKQKKSYSSNSERWILTLTLLIELETELPISMQKRCIKRHLSHISGLKPLIQSLIYWYISWFEWTIIRNWTRNCYWEPPLRWFSMAYWPGTRRLFPICDVVVNCWS